MISWIKVIFMFFYLSVFRRRITSYHISVADGYGTEEFLHISTSEFFSKTKKYITQFRRYSIKIENIYGYNHITLEFYN